MKIGATQIHINPGERCVYKTQKGYARINGLYFDFVRRTILGICFYYIRLRESDTHPECHAGYLVSDRFYNPNLPSYARYY